MVQVVIGQRYGWLVSGGPHRIIRKYHTELLATMAGKLQIPDRELRYPKCGQAGCRTVAD